MDNMVNIYLFGKKYEVPSELTIMTAMEYAGYDLVRGCGCRNGFCGACLCVYRIGTEQKLTYCLACQTQVKDNMYIATLPYFPTAKKIYDIEKISVSQQLMMQLYPEIFKCIGCNACTKACTQNLNVMQYIAYAQRGDFEKCANESFDCVMCRACSTRCPAGISHPEVAMLARRLNGRYIQPESEHLAQMLRKIEGNEFEEKIRELMSLSDDKIKELYNTREIEQ